MVSNAIGTASWLVEELVAAKIVERERLEPYLAEFTAETPYADADALAKHLAREGVLSKYQAKRALEGEAKKLMLGAYILVEVIGNGSLGPVYKALGRGDGKPYAVKVLPRRSWNVRLARSQVRAFEALPDCHGVVPFVDVGTAHGLHYLVWPLAAGRTLESIIHEFGPLSPGEIAQIGVRIAEALKLCLSHGLIHGLIKACNVLIAPDGQPRLLDFGIGALLAENPEDDLLVDTVARAETLARILECAAPECVADSSKWTPAGDQYSLGCTLYFAATGRYPFPGGTFVEKIINHQSKKPPAIRSLNPDIPPGLAETIERLMNKSPTDRYPKLDDLIRELAPLVTVTRLRQPTPVNVQTPLPKRRLAMEAAPVVPGVKEPAILNLPPVEPKRGLFGRLVGSGDPAAGILKVAVIAASPLQPGDAAVLHVYVYGDADERELLEACKGEAADLRVLGTARTKRPIIFGSRVGLHLTIANAAIDEPLQEFDYVRDGQIRRFALTVAADSLLRLGNSKLMIGQDSRLIAEIDFALPVGE